MKRLARAAILTTLADELESRGSWVGETHLQKATYFLQEAAGVPLEYEFILYKHGPFAFDLREDLGGFRAERLLDLRPQTYPYGPRLMTAEGGRAVQEKFPRTLDSAGKAITTVATFIGSRGVGELERLGTALMLLNESRDASDDALAEEMRRIKPHVASNAALEAVQEVRTFLSEVNKAADNT